MPHKILYSVDLKDMEANKCYLVYEIIAKHRKERHVIWGSGNEEAHAKLLELDPDIPRYYNAFSLIMTYIWYLFGKDDYFNYYLYSDSNSHGQHV